MGARAGFGSQHDMEAECKDDPPQVQAPVSAYTDVPSRSDLYPFPRRQSEASHSMSRSRGAHFTVMPPSARDQKRKHLTAEWTQKPSSSANERLGKHKPQYTDIGMALGSPSQALSTGRKESDARDSSISIIASTPRESLSGLSEVASAEPKQRTRWKVLGGLFSKKAGPSPSSSASFYNAIPEAPYHTPVLAPFQSPTQKVVPQYERRTHFARDPNLRDSIDTLWPGRLEPRPSMLRSYTSPEEPLISRLPTPPPKPSTPSTPTTPINVDPTPSRPPVLHLNIPDVKMERYSIMFGNVLGIAQPPKTQATIMARRKQQVERLRAIEDVHAEDAPNEVGPTELKRRATISSPIISANSVGGLPQTQRGIERSPPLSQSFTRPFHKQFNTALAVSPTRVHFEMVNPSNNGQSNIVLSVDSPSPSTESPETPRMGPWQAETNESVKPIYIEDFDVNPRGLEEATIKLEPVLETGSTETKTFSAASQTLFQPPPRRDSKAKNPRSNLQKLPSSQTLRSKYSTQPLPELPKDRKPLMGKPAVNLEVSTEWSANENYKRSRNASLPAPTTKVVETITPRKSSLPTQQPQSYHSLESTRPRNMSLQQSQRPMIRTSRSPSLQTIEQYASLQSHSRQQQPSPPAALARLAAHRQTRAVAAAHTANGDTTVANTEPEVRPDHRTTKNASSAHESGTEPTTEPARKDSLASGLPPQPLHNRNGPLHSSPATAAEISIARQISISRRQQQMIPVVSKTARQPQQATLVVPGGERHTKGHVSRKSHHVLVESV